MSLTTPLAASLPVTVTVAPNGAVTVTSATRVIGMSPFSERARFLSLMLGEGRTVVATDADADALPFGTVDSLADALD